MELRTVSAKDRSQFWERLRPSMFLAPIGGGAKVLAGVWLDHVLAYGSNAQAPVSRIVYDSIKAIFRDRLFSFNEDPPSRKINMAPTLVCMVDDEQIGRLGISGRNRPSQSRTKRDFLPGPLPHGPHRHEHADPSCSN